ncbi:hypothetical protein D3C77_551590 [compost metagenome]
MVDGELGQAQLLLARLAALQILAGSQQAPLQLAVLRAQRPGRAKQGQQQQGQQQGQTAPEAGRFAQAGYGRPQPALLQRLQLRGGQFAEGLVDQAGQFRLVAPHGDT